MIGIKEICNSVEVVGGVKTKAMRQSIMNAALDVAYNITLDQFNEIKKSPRFRKDTETNADRQLKEALHQKLGGPYWEFIDVFSTALNSSIVRSHHIADDDTNPFHSPPKTRREHFGIMAYKGDTVLISFKGSQTFSSWISDISIKPLDTQKFHPHENRMDYIRRFFNYEGARIHRGFTRAALSSQEEIFDSLKSYQQNHKQNHLNVIVTGHSLGGAMATIFCAPLKSFLEEVFPRHTLNLITFGSPRAFLDSTYHRAIEVYRRKIAASHRLRVVTSSHEVGVMHDHVAGLPATFEGKWRFLTYWEYSYEHISRDGLPIVVDIINPVELHTTCYRKFIDLQIS